MMLRAVIYSRFSSDLQRDSSIEDQNRVCQQRIDQEGWRLTDTFSDYAISGASLERPALKTLMGHAALDKFDIVVVEGLDRLSRDTEHMPGIYKRLTFRGVRIYSLSDGGFVSDLHIAFGGAKNAMFLKDLAFKVWRGQSGLAKKGKAMTKPVYGYDMVRRFDANGEAVKGERSINLKQAAIVTRIFSDYAAGKSARAIAKELNAEHIPTATQYKWNAGTINGVRTKGTGLLNNEIYIGRMIWNKRTYQKNPDTEQRVEQINDKKDWIIADVPELRIIPQELWDKVKARQIKLAGKSGLSQKRRPKNLLSYRLKCGACGGGYAKMSSATYGCHNARDKGTCDNRIGMNQTRIESAVLDALATQLLAPELVETFADEYQRHLRSLSAHKDTERIQLQKRLHALDHEKDKLINAIKAGIPAEELTDTFNENAAQRANLTAQLERCQNTVPQPLKPNMTVRYQGAIESLKDTPASGQDARIDLIQDLIEKVVLTPIANTRKLKATLHGDLAALLAQDKEGHTIPKAIADGTHHQQESTSSPKWPIQHTQPAPPISRES